MGKFIGVEHHEVSFKGEGGVWTRRCDHVGTEGEVRNELSVHDIPLDSINTSVFECAHFFTESGEVGGKNRRSDVNWSSHKNTLPKPRNAVFNQTHTVC